VDEFQRYVAITAFRHVRIKNTDEFLELIGMERLSGYETQVFSARLLATWQHLFFAVLNALMAFKSKANISKSLAMETLLYASAQRQIHRATEILGIKPNSENIALLVIGERPETLESIVSKIAGRVDGIMDETILGLTKEKMTDIQRAFGISYQELRAIQKGNRPEEALVDLVTERMALLAIER
jgi:tRNA threonylcarbamoyladenosine modification (KEOPS) complex Cgi121 subunit